jgi:hypothetical protein
MAAGRLQPDGSYPAESIHGRVQRRLATLATRLAQFGGRRRLAADLPGLPERRSDRDELQGAR